MFPLASSFSILGGARDPGMVDCRLYPRVQDRVLKPKGIEFFSEKHHYLGPWTLRVRALHPWL